MGFLRSGFRIRVPHRNAIAIRNSFRIPGWVGPGWVLRKGARHGPLVRVSGGCLVGSCGSLAFWPSASRSNTSHHFEQNFAFSGDIACGGAVWLDVLIMTTPCERYLFKLKLTVVACIAQANHPIEQNYLIQWAIGDILPPQVFPTWMRRL